MHPIDLAAVAAGVVAYGVAVLASTLLVFLLYRVNARLASRVEEERLLLAGHRSIAISLGAILLSQAVLLRHAVFPIMVVVRELFLGPLVWREALVSLAQCALFLLVVAALSVGSITLASLLFTRMTGKLPEHEEILKDNVAVAIFYAFVLLSITTVLNEGMEDLARSLVPYGSSGVLTLP